MRVWSAVLGLVLLWGVEASAQEISWGIKGGVNFATLTFDADPQPDFKYRIGLVGGGFFTLPLGSHFDVQPEILFSQQGATFDATDVEPEIRLDSLVTPVLVRFTPGSSGRGLVIFGGPSIGFTLTAKVKAAASSTNTTEDISDQVKGVDYGVVFGAGWEAGRLTIDGRYTWGVSALEADETAEATTRHRVIAVMAGVRF
jgi:hypothetical protein